MPDKNFEQQAQDMANGFNMEPSPASWQQIRNAIGEKRKRRIAIWWWLLPLCLAGGSVALYTFLQMNKQAVITKNIMANSKVKSKNIKERVTQTKPNKESEKLISPTIKSKNKQEQTRPNTPNKNDENPEVKINKTLTPSALQKKNNPAITKQYKNDKEVIYSSENKTNNGKKINENNVADADKNVQINKAETAQADNLKKDKTSEFDRDKMLDSSKNSLAKNNENSSAEKFGLAEKDSAIIQQKSNDSSIKMAASKHDTAAPVARINKQKKLHAWHFGIVAEGGIAARSSSVLSLASLEKSTALPSTFFNAVGQTGSSTGGFYNEERIKHGAAYGFGIALQKLINRKIDFFADVTYQHQSSKIAAVTYYDSVLFNGLSNVSLAGSYHATQSFHFASLYTGFNWHFINKKNLGFGISAGADNFFLLSAKQNFNNISSASTQEYVQRINSNNALVKSSYYTYQPSLFAGILMNVKMRANQQLQVTPFVRSGINKFEKNTSANNNHLFSSGLRAVYFFN